MKLLVYCCWLLLSVESVSASDASRQVLGSFREFLLAGFGDYDNDKQTDLFVLDPDRRGFEVALMDHTKTPMLQRKNLRCVYDDLVLVSLVPSDFDGDGVMDVVVVARQLSESAADSHLIAFPLWGDLTALRCLHNNTSQRLQLLGQPLALDYDGDMATDLLGMMRNGSRAVWFFNRNRVARLQPLEGSPLRVPQLSSFCDVTGDLAADLLLATSYGYELWVHEQEGWLNHSMIPLPSGVKHIGQSAFLDVDSTGRVQHVVPVCYDDGCHNSSLLLWANNSWIRLLLEIEDSVDGLWGFPVPQPDEVYGDVIVPRVGDYNLDGYPDLLMSLERKDGSVSSLRAFLLKNIPCPSVAQCSGVRAFSAEWRTFAEISDSPAAAFYDVGDDGLLDALVLHRVDGKPTVSVDRNSPDYDALFLKMMVINGGCYHNCSHGVQLPYGTNRPGPAALGRMTLTDGTVRAFAAAQLSQSTHHALQLPYSVFGLGRSPNFVDVLQVGVPTVAGRPAPLTKQWTQLIPNSQLIVIPHPPDQPRRWINKLYVTPSETIMATLGALLGTLVATVVVVIILHWRERREDKLERMQEAHRFNFDAM